MDLKACLTASLWQAQIDGFITYAASPRGVRRTRVAVRWIKIPIVPQRLRAIQEAGQKDDTGSKNGVACR
ncbi:hypothetical protein, partial [Hydrogenophaga sp.]|uniref:hypothetical protein n=1 Tax=Hydrogenophaga sp. TaxID=1904254 RepID=UPI00261B9716